MSIRRRRESLLKSSISINTIRDSAVNFTDGLSKSNTTARNIAQKTNENNNFKRRLIGKDNEFFRRRRESEVRVECDWPCLYTSPKMAEGPSATHIEWYCATIGCVSSSEYILSWLPLFKCYSRPLISKFFVLDASNDANDPMRRSTNSMAIDSVGLRSGAPPGTKGSWNSSSSSGSGKR